MHSTVCRIENTETGIQGLDSLSNKTVNSSAEFLTTKEAAAFLKISISALHKLTCQRRITFYKPRPMGKIYFLKTDLIEYFNSGKKPPLDSIGEDARSQLLDLNRKRMAPN